ncbi:MAG: lysophospholipid acyltransferase family protein [Pirellulaceae bacterium]
MQQNASLTTKLGGLATAVLGSRWSATLHTQIAHYDLSADPARPEFQGPVVLAFWHEYIMVPFSMWGHCNIAMLTSQHRDANWLAQAGYHLGYATVRGSSTHGGSAALRELKRLSRTMTLAITPDGPKGPRRRLAMGPVFLASRLGLPLVPMGFGFDRPWRLTTWDRFAVPRPFSRCRIVWGPRMPIPRRLDRSGLEHYRQQVEGVLNCITTEAEDWAESGTRRHGQRSVIRRPPRRTGSTETAAGEDVRCDVPPDSIPPQSVASPPCRTRTSKHPQRHRRVDRRRADHLQH